MKKQIICIRWGTKYGPEYVNRLYGMVSRNITPPFDFYCFTDDPEGVRPEVSCLPLPDLDCDLPKTRKGVWGKSRLWRKDLGGLSGPVLFMDLDVVIVGNIDGFFEYGSEDDVILARNPNTPFERLGQTSLYRFPIGKLEPMRQEFLSDPQKVAETFVFEQRFVTRRAPGGIKFWPSGWVSLFKWHCMRQFPLNYFLPPKLPAKSKVVIFPGGLNPPDAIAGRWNVRSPVLPPFRHFLATFTKSRNGSVSEHLRHFLHPAEWVSRNWRE
ncbi:glycosyl transferase [Ostreiculturibacter nitratireducens]|uniref:glycosyl transferase n=1 Tax=Ostreiculturibacter nitratireducens TaxID=3075226 RepID=UPI0031B61CD8